MPRYSLASLLVVCIVLATTVAHFAAVDHAKERERAEGARKHHSLFRSNAGVLRTRAATEGDQLRVSDKNLLVKVVAIDGNAVTFDYKYALPQYQHMHQWKRCTDELEFQDGEEHYGTVWFPSGFRSAVSLAITSATDDELHYGTSIKTHW